MKDVWRNYATKNRLISKGYFTEYRDGGKARKAREASRRNRLQQSWKKQEEEVSQSCKPALHPSINIEDTKENSMKNSDKKKVLKHLKEDKHEFREQIKDDTKLAKQLKDKKKSK